MVSFLNFFFALQSPDLELKKPTIQKCQQTWTKIILTKRALSSPSYKKESLARERTSRQYPFSSRQQHRKNCSPASQPHQQRLGAQPGFPLLRSCDKHLKAPSGGWYQGKTIKAETFILLDNELSPSPTTSKETTWELDLHLPLAGRGHPLPPPGMVSEEAQWSEARLSLWLAIMSCQPSHSRPQNCQWNHMGS